MRLRRYFVRRTIVPRPTWPSPLKDEPPYPPQPAPAPSIDVNLLLAPPPPSAEAPRPVETTPAAAPPPAIVVRRDPPHRAFPFHRVHHHRPGKPVPKPLARRLALFTAVAINALALAVLAAGLYARFGPAKSSGNNLRSENASHKLQATSAWAAAVPEAVPPQSRDAKLEEPPSAPPPVRPEPELTLPEVAEPPPLVPVPAPPVVPPPPVVSMPPVVPAPEAPAPTLVSEPPAAAPTPSPGEDLWQSCLVYARIPGETPMLRTWKMLKLASAFTAALALAPVALAQDEDAKKDDVKTILKRLDKMDEALKAEFKKIKEGFDKIDGDITKIRMDILQRDVAFGDLDKQVQKMAKDIDNIKKKLPSEGNIAYYQGSDKALEEIRQRLDQIEKLLVKLQPTQQRVAMAAPTNGLGRMMLVNMYPEELLFVINGRSYRVESNRTMPLEGVPPGTLSYEVISPTWGRRAARTTTLGANETLTVTAQ
jgi:hypothetical protein